MQAILLNTCTHNSVALILGAPVCKRSSMQNDSSHTASPAQSDESAHRAEDDPLDKAPLDVRVMAKGEHDEAQGRHATSTPNEAEALRIQQRLRRGLAALVGLVILSFILSWLFRDWLTEVGHYLIGAYGARGVFTSVFFIDWTPIPTSSEPIYMLGISSGMDLTELFVASCAGGVVAALGCYASGAVLERTTSIGDWTRARYPGMVQWVSEKGFKGLALAAVVPLPFSPMMWIAGVIGMPIEQVVVISLLRIPKTIFYLLILMAAWELT